MEEYSILIVDDVPENIDILVNLLKYKYKMKAAVSGAQAMTIANSDDPPDIILLDIMMPGMSGLEVCEKLKAREKTKDIPVIFLTAISEINSIMMGFTLGGVDYITKPFNPIELTTRLNTHLKLRKATEDLKNQNLILEETVEKRTALLREKNELLNHALKEKDALLEEVRSMEVKLRESLEMLNKSYRKIQSIQEEERKRISLDLHDHMGQLLTVIKLNLYQIRGKSDPKNEKLCARINSTIQLADEAIKATQLISMQLRPDILDNLGFREAVNWYCRMMHDASGIAFEVEMKGAPAALAKETEVGLYRVLQEAVTNIIRHSRAKKCRVRIEQAAEAVRISICDDGIGLDGRKVNDGHSLGIFGMKKRIENLQGEVTIAGAPGRGTVITITVPADGGAGD